MKRLNSRFERIEHVRRQQERLARVNASLRNAEVTRAETQADQVQQQLEGSLEAVNGLLSDRFAAAILNTLQARCDAEGTLVEKAAEKLEVARGSHKESLAEFETARSNLRVVEKLVANERKNHKRANRRAAEADAMERNAQEHSERIQQSTGTLS